MNICILKEALTIGGTERSAANISKILQGEHNVTVALYDASDIKYSYAGTLEDFNLPPKDSFLGKVLNTFLRDIKLRKLLKKECIDFLYTFTGVGNRQTRYRYRTAKIISARDFGKMEEKLDLYSKALQNSDAMICNSERTKEFYLSHYPEDAHKVYALYNYIDEAEIREQAKEETDTEYVQFLKQHPQTLVSVGRFCEEKGFEYLIEALGQAQRSIPGVGLVLVGDGEYKQRYLDCIKRLGIEEHVYFTGFQANPYKYMARCDCFVLSSLSEGFPNVLAEAMALRLPVIAANCLSGPAEILREDKDYHAVLDRYEKCDFGILTPRIVKGDNTNAVAQLSEAMSELLLDQSMMTHYAHMSEERVQAFSEEAARVKLKSIFSEILERRTKK